MKTKQVIQRVFIIQAMFITGLLFSGGSCATHTVLDRNATVAEIHTDGSISVNGIIISLEQLPYKLKSLGFTPDMTIKIRVYESKPTPTMKAVAACLKNAGFGRIMFVSERRASSTVKDKTSSQTE